MTLPNGKSGLILGHNSYSTTPGGPGVTANAPIEDATTTRSGWDGSFSLACLPAGEHNLAVVKRGYPTKVVAVDVTYDMSPLKIEMGLGGTIYGRIVDEAGEAIPKAYVYAGRWNTGNGEYSVNLGADGDQDGHFVIEHIPLEGSVEFSFGVRREEGGRRDRSYMGMSTSIMVPREEPYEITMYQRPVFQGTVVDDETGQPVREFEVKNGWQRERSERIDWISMSTPSKIQSDEGHFSKKLDGVHISYPTTTAFAVGILAEGYLPATSPLVKLGEPIEPFVIRLRKGEPIRGVVTDALAQPVEGAEVFWIASGQSVYVRNGKFQQRVFIDTRTKTNNRGRFKLPASEESGHLFVLHDSGYHLVEHSRPSDELTLTLIPWARVEGTAYRGSETRPNTTVTLVSETTAQYYLNPRITRMEPSPVQWSFDDTSHIDGNFIFDRVPAVPMIAGMRATGNQYLSQIVGIHPHANEILSIQIGGGGETVTGSLDLTVPPYATTPFDPRWVRTIARRITGDATENSIPPSYAAVFEEDGAFSIDDIPHGEYELEIVAYGYPQNHEREAVELASALIQFTVSDTSTDQIPIPPIQLEASDTSL